MKAPPPPLLVPARSAAGLAAATREARNLAWVGSLLFGVLAFLCLGSVATRAQTDAITLAGKWQFQLDPRDAGLAEGWFGRILAGKITLPTTTDLAGFGAPEPDPNPGFLSREHKFIGPAWYRRDIVIPET